MQKFRTGLRGRAYDRVGGLSSENRRLFTIAALLGRRFDSITLALAVKTAFEPMVIALRDAAAAGILVAQDRRGYQWQFRHALVHEAFTDGVPTATLRELHGAILNAMELFPDGERDLDRLAYHAQQAQNRSKALLYNERAGDAALRMRACWGAACYFRTALQSADDLENRHRLQLKIAAATPLNGKEDPP